MAFCNSCGTTLTPGARFCNKCGAAILASTPVTSASAASATPVATVPVPAAAPPPAGNSALKVILIVVGAIMLLGILSLVSVSFFAWRMAHRAHIRQENGNVKVDTPFGSVETTKDPEEAARTLGVDLYPGAEVLKDGSTSASFGSVHTSTLNSETSDSPDKVCAFYKPKFPQAMVVSSDINQCNIVSNDRKNMVTISAKEERGKTRIVITNVSKSGSGNSSSQ